MGDEGVGTSSDLQDGEREQLHEVAYSSIKLRYLPDEGLDTPGVNSVLPDPSAPLVLRP